MRDQKASADPVVGAEQPPEVVTKAGVPMTPNSRGRRGARVSIQDVARRAGVSTATVSRVLNTPTMVSEATAHRVQAAIAELDYRPNLMAKALMTRRSNVLGLTLPDTHGEFYMDVLHGADERARSRGYHLLVSTDHAQQRALGIQQVSPAHGLVDGVAVMLTEPNESVWNELARADVPVVALDARPTNVVFDTVHIDNTPGTAEAMALLLDTCDPERCYFVGGPAGTSDNDERGRAFRVAMSGVGHVVRPDQIANGAYSVEWGRAWAEAAHERGELDGAGVFAANDDIAVGVMQAARLAGLSVPDHVEVIGFDNSRVASMMVPALTSVAVPRRDFGAAAVDMLIRRIEQPDAEAKAIRLPTRLVTRRSTRGGVLH